MFARIKDLFRCKMKADPKPLCIDGATVKLTPRPNESETSAAALLEMLTGEADINTDSQNEQKPDNGTPEYYHALAKRIRSNREHEARDALRLIAYCEEQLSIQIHNVNAFELENELYTVQATVERERGELLTRWQHCLAEVVVRQMQKASKEPRYIDSKENKPL